MSARLKIVRGLLASIRADLGRRHFHAAERVGFLTAGVARMNDGSLLLLARDYHPVADNDYVPNASVGAMIGPEAMRKGLQAAYRSRSALLHVHSHGGRGRPEFSSVDLNDSRKFVPGFFNVVPQMPHGIVVLSEDSARGLLWMGRDLEPHYIDGFAEVGAPYQKFGAAA
jgi:hypothetical protein